MPIPKAQQKMHTIQIRTVQKYMLYNIGRSKMYTVQDAEHNVSGNRCVVRNSYTVESVCGAGGASCTRARCMRKVLYVAGCIQSTSYQFTLHTEQVGYGVCSIQTGQIRSKLHSEEYRFPASISSVKSSSCSQLEKNPCSSLIALPRLFRLTIPLQTATLIRTPAYHE